MTDQDNARQAGLIATMIGEWYFHADEHVKSKLADFSNVLLDRFAAQSADARNGERVALPMELRGIAEAVASGKGFWTPCTGCYDTEDGRPTQKYAHSAAFGCEMGCGCSECGGLGVVWDDTDYEEMARFMADNEAAPATPAPKCHPTVECCGKEPCELAAPTDPRVQALAEVEAHLADTAARQAGLTDEQIADAIPLTAMIVYGAVSGDPKTVRMNLGELREFAANILAAQSADASIYQELDPSGLWEDISKERFDELKIRSDVRVRAFGQSADARNGEGVALQLLREIIAHDDAWEKETQMSRVSASRADEYLSEFMALKDKARALLEKNDG